MLNNNFSGLRKFRIPKTIKRIFNLFAGLFLTYCCFFVAYFQFQNGSVDLNNIDQFKGIVTEKGSMTYQTSSNGRYLFTLNKQVFYFKIKGLNNTLGVYNPKENYDFLENSLQGDNF